MRRFATSLLCLILILLSVLSCDFNSSLRTRMVEYYSNNDNYIEIQGVVHNVRYIEEIKQLRLDVKVLTKTEEFYVNTETGLVTFNIVENETTDFLIDVNDEVVFYTAPWIFYNGHINPIISLRCNDAMLIDFEEGKAKYLSWINDEFN